MNNFIFTKLPSGEIIDTFLSSFSSMIITRKYFPEYDEEGEFNPPFGKNVIIDKINSPTKNIYLVHEFIEKRHKEILKTLKN